MKRIRSLSNTRYVVVTHIFFMYKINRAGSDCSELKISFYLCCFSYMYSQEKNKELCGDSYNQEYLEYICVDNCGNLIRPDYVTETFLKLLKKKKLKIIRFHDLRHTCASILLKNGANMK